MNGVLDALAVVTQALRSALLFGGVALAAVAAVDWGVRTRRINPFSGVARFMRGRVEPRLAGIERQVTRVGGHPASTPWWALVVYVVCGALLLAGVDLLASLVREAMVASSMGGLGLIVLAVHWVFRFLQVALLIRVIASWFPRLAMRPWISWSFGATEWMLRPLRRVIPTFGVMDVTPIVAYFALQITEWLVTKVLLAGMG
jgi:YggT family protein